MRTLYTALTILLATCSAAFAGIDQGLLNLVPPGTKVLAGVQLETSRNSTFGQYLLSQVQTNSPGFQSLLDATGFDPRRDLQEVLIASTGAPPENSHQSPFIVLARGYFDAAKIRAAVLSKGGQATKTFGVDMLSGKGGDSTSIAILEPTLAVAGRTDVVRALLSTRSTPESPNTDLTAKAQAVSSSSEAWFASVQPGSELPANMTIAGENGQAINGAVVRSVLQCSGGVHFGAEALTVRFDALTKSPKDAEALSDVFRFFASMVQMQNQNTKETALLAPALDQMKLTTSDSTMHMSLSVPEKTVEQLLAHKRTTAVAGASGE